MIRIVVALLIGLMPAVAAGQTSELATAVRAATGEKDWPRAERLVADHRTNHGVNTENILAVSWLGRGALAERRWADAERYARQARTEALAALKGRSVDSDPFTPGAIGNAIDVLAQVQVERGARSDAVRFVQDQLHTYRGSSIEKRIQKTLNVYTLEGTAAPGLDLSEFIGATPPTLSSFKGQVVLLFFWAHWCPDCKAQAPILARLYEKYRNQGLVIVAPTQRYGYVAGGATASAADEKVYIEQVRAEYYPVLADVPMPLATANHLRYGVSSTPTLAIVDRAGFVRLYNPGRMTEDALDTQLQKWVAAR